MKGKIRTYEIRKIKYFYFQLLFYLTQIKVIVKYTFILLVGLVCKLFYCINLFHFATNHFFSAHKMVCPKYHYQIWSRTKNKTCPFLLVFFFGLSLQGFVLLMFVCLEFFCSSYHVLGFLLGFVLLLFVILGFIVKSSLTFFCFLHRKEIVSRGVDKLI